MKKNTLIGISSIVVSLAIIALIAIYFPPKATVLSIERNYDLDNITMREYLTFAKEPIPTFNESPRLDKKFNFIIKFSGYFNESHYREVNPDDALWITGSVARNSPTEQSGYIFTQRLPLRGNEFLEK